MGNELKKIGSALISVYRKEGLERIVRLLDGAGVELYSTGGTQDFILSLGVGSTPVESLTGYPSILGGRVKTLHPGVFGGILSRRGNGDDERQLQQYSIPEIDLVIVDLYPFEQTVASGATEAEIIEKIDIGGISLIRAAAKNHSDVAIVAARGQYDEVYRMLEEQGCATTLPQRRRLAGEAFAVSSHYDAAIFNYFNRQERIPAFRAGYDGAAELRYGENPHQQAVFYGDVEAMFDKLWGKDLSYNNMLDIDAALSLVEEYDEPTFAILKHNNACGIASRPSLADAWRDALAADPVSAFGGVLICNRPVDEAAAQLIDKIFFEVIIAPGFETAALETLKGKKNRIILRLKDTSRGDIQFRTLLNGVAVQGRDRKVGGVDTDLTVVTTVQPSVEELDNMVFANKIVKHSKSNAIVLARDGMMLASGVGQTSRVDALRQAIAKAQSFGFDLLGAAMASDAFFPFADCVEIARAAGITSVIQPGGSVRDAESVEFCDSHGMAMVFTGMRHFKH